MIRNILRNAGLIDNCRFIEHIPVKKIPSYVKYANALFLSLSNEKIFYNTVPAKLQSYMAMGKPIIGVMSGEGADIIKKSQCGFVIENYDYTELAFKIRDLSKMSSDELDKFGIDFLFVLLLILLDFQPYKKLLLFHQY